MPEDFNPQDLASLMAYIGGRYQFTSKSYPSLEGKTEQERQAFAVSHSVHHLAKSLGALASECELYDHGGEMDQEVLRMRTVKMFISAIKLAEELGMTPQELGEAVPVYMRSH